MTDIVTYYKAVRPNGTDFATGTTRPVVGEWMPRIEGELFLCERGYHVSDAVAETLIGGSWPCRLFEVEIPEGEWEREHHKRVVPTYRPIKELPAWQALGPNGEAVAALIERCKTLTEGQNERLAAAWDAAWAAAWSAARDAAWDPARDAARHAAWDAAWYAAWDATWYAARPAARDAVRDAAWDAAWDATWYAARPAARDAAGAAAWSAARDAARAAVRDAAAAGALVVRDLITSEQFNALYGPWASVMEARND